MIAVLLDGTSHHISPGSAICGLGFKQVTLDFKDCRPEHRDWLNVTLSTRLPEVEIVPRKIIEVIGPKMAYFEFPDANGEVYRIPYRSIKLSSQNPVALAKQLDAALGLLRSALAITEGDGPAILFWRNDNRYEINPVIDSQTGEPTGRYQTVCRLGTYPVLDELLWFRLDSIDLLNGPFKEIE